MSEHWHLYCVTCNLPGMHRGDNTNHWEAEMAALAKAAPKLAEMARVVKDLRVGFLDPELRVDDSTNLARPRIDLDWFTEHAGHAIVPQNEYGHLLTECSSYVVCKSCGSQHACRMPWGHEGDCEAGFNRPSRDAAKMAAYDGGPWGIRLLPRDATNYEEQIRRATWWEEAGRRFTASKHVAEIAARVANEVDRQRGPFYYSAHALTEGA